MVGHANIQTTTRYVGVLEKEKEKAAKANKKGEKKSGGFDVDLKSGGGLMEMMGGFTVLRLTSLMGAANVKVTKEQLLGINAQLLQIPKP